MSKQYLKDQLWGRLAGFKSRSRKLARGERGFTLIELLVVVAIMGVLAGIITPTVAHFANTGKTQAANTELQTVKTGIAAAISDNDLAQNDVCTPTAPVTSFASTYIDGAGNTCGTAGSLGSAGALWPNYLSDQSVDTAAGVYGYCWTDLGIVTQYTTSTSAC